MSQISATYYFFRVRAYFEQNSTRLVGDKLGVPISCSFSCCRSFLFILNFENQLFSGTYFPLQFCLWLHSFVYKKILPGLILVLLQKVLKYIKLYFRMESVWFSLIKDVTGHRLRFLNGRKIIYLNDKGSNYTPSLKIKFLISFFFSIFTFIFILHFQFKKVCFRKL